MRQIILECRNKKEGATYILRAEDVRSWNEWVNILTSTLTHIGNIWFEEQHQQKNNGKYKSSERERCIAYMEAL